MKKRGRPVEIHIKLTKKQRAELRQMARRSVGRVSERAHFVLLSDKGKSVPEIAELMDYSAETVYGWLERYREQGAAGLDDEERSGRPPKEPHLKDIVETQAGQSPECSGYTFSNWTVDALTGHLQRRFKVLVSRSSMRRALREAGFSWGRPKLEMPRRKDPEAQAKMARIDQVLKQAEVTIIAEDESEVHQLPVLRAKWRRRGQQSQVPTPGQNKKCALFGGVNLRTGECHNLITKRKRSVEFIEFLSGLLAAYPTGLIYVLVDNVSIHTSKKTHDWLASHPRLKLVYLPTYSGHKLNPVEKIWWHLKAKIAANRCFKTLDALIAAVHRYFEELSAECVLRLINSPIVRQAQCLVAA